MAVSFDDLNKKYKTNTTVAKQEKQEEKKEKEEVPASFEELNKKYKGTTETTKAEQARINKENDLIGAKDAEKLNSLPYKAKTPTLENREQLKKEQQAKAQGELFDVLSKPFENAKNDKVIKESVNLDNRDKKKAEVQQKVWESEAGDSYSANLLKGLGNRYRSTVGNAIEDTAEAFVDLTEAEITGYKPGDKITLANREAARAYKMGENSSWFMDPIKEVAREVAASNHAGDVFDLATAQILEAQKGTNSQFAKDVISAADSSAQMLAYMSLPGGATNLSAYMAIPAAAEKYNQVRAEGGSKEEAFTKGIISGAISYLVERSGGIGGKGNVIEDVAAKNFVTRVVSELAQEGGEELVQYGLEYINEAVFDLYYNGKTDAEFNLGEALHQAWVGGLAGGGFGLVGSVSDAISGNSQFDSTVSEVASNVADIIKAKFNSKKIHTETTEKVVEPVGEAVQETRKVSEPSAVEEDLKNLAKEVVEEKAEETATEKPKKAVSSDSTGHKYTGGSNIKVAVSTFENAKENTGKAIEALYDPADGLDKETFIKAAHDVYKYGSFSYPKTDMMAESEYAKYLPEEKRVQIYSIGQNNAKEANVAKAAEIQKTVLPGVKAKIVPENNVDLKKLDEAHKVQIDLLDKVLSPTTDHEFRLYASYVLKKDITYTNKEGKNVFLKAGTRVRRSGGEIIEAANGANYIGEHTIEVDVNAGAYGQGAINDTVSHEYVHELKVQSPEKYNELVDIVSEVFERNNRSFRKEVAAKIEAYEKHNVKLKEGDAQEEIVAQAMSGMWDDPKTLEVFSKTLYEKNKSLWNEIKDFIADIIKRIKAALKTVVPESEEARMLREQQDLYERAQKVYVEGIIEAGENYKAYSKKFADLHKTTEGSSDVYKTADGRIIAVSEKGNENNVKYNIGEYRHGGRDILFDWLNQVVDTKSKDQVIKAMDAAAEIVETLEKQIPVFKEWGQVGLTFDASGKPVLRCKVKNGEYEINFDFSTICKKRKALDKVLNELIKSGKINLLDLSKSDIQYINDVLNKHDFEIACGLCFVDSKRYRVGEWASNAATMYNDIVNSLVKPENIDKINSFNFGGNKDIKNIGDDISTWDNSLLDFTTVDNILNTKSNAEGMGYKKAFAKLIKENPKYRQLITSSDILSSAGTDKMRDLAPDLLAAINAVGGTSKPKMSNSESVWDHSILLDNRITKEAAFAMGGARTQSFSDFVATMFFDYCQMFAEAQGKGLPMQAYTKEMAFAKLFGLTGARINLSVLHGVDISAEDRAWLDSKYKVDKKTGELKLYVTGKKDKARLQAIMENAGLDKNGNYVYEKQSINFNEAVDLQSKEGYSRYIGTIVVGISEKHILKLLDDGRVRMIIPYHKSGLSAVIAKARNIDCYTDFTKYQNTRLGKSWGKDAGKSKGSAKLSTETKERLKELKDNGEMWDFYSVLHHYEAEWDTGTNSWKKGTSHAETITYELDSNGVNTFKNDPMRQTCEDYITWCEEHDMIPQFEQFIKHPNYYKMQEDFDVYDCITGEYVPQSAVEFKLPENASEVLLDELKLQQKESDRLDKEMSGIVDDIIKERGRQIPPEINVGRKGKFSLRDSDRDSEYMEAVKKADIGTMQKLVEEAAKEAGYTEKLYHGTNRFGFTVPRTEGLEGGVEWSPFFATDSEEVARTYSGIGGTRWIADNTYSEENINRAYDNAEKEMTDAENELYFAFNRQFSYGLDFKDLSHFADKLSDELYMEQTSEEDIYMAIDEYLNLWSFWTELKEDYGEFEDYEDFEDWEDSKEAEPIWHAMQRLELAIINYAKVRDMTGLEDVGNYGLYANPNNLFEIDAKGAYWNQIPFEQYDSNRKKINTRNLAAYARDNGYKGVKISNVFDDGGRGPEQTKPATVYIFFNPQEQVKSADPVTKDDNGNVIPLSERFKKGNQDIRYSYRDYSVEENKAVMTKARIDYLIEDSGAGSRKDYAQAWITSINPTDYINLTTDEKSQNREVFDKFGSEWDPNVNMGNYDYLGQLGKTVRQTPYLAIDINTGDVVGHDGRHRIRALEKEGITSVEIMVEFREDGKLVKYEPNGERWETLNGVRLTNQFGTGQKALIENVIPLNEDHRNEIEASYGEMSAKDTNIKYSVRKGVDKGSGQWNNKKHKGSVYDEFASIAMSWANEAGRKAGDIKQFYSVKHDKIVDIEADGNGNFNVIYVYSEKEYDELYAYKGKDRFSGNSSGQRVSERRSLQNNMYLGNKRKYGKIPRQADRNEQTGNNSSRSEDADSGNSTTELKKLQERLSSADQKRVQILENKIARLEGELANMEKTYEKAQNYARAEGVLAGQIEQGKKMAKTIEAKKKQIADIRKQKNDLLAKAKIDKEEALAKLRKADAEKLEKALAKAKAFEMAKLFAAKTRSEEQKKAIVNKYRESIKKATEKRHNTDVRHKIRRVVNELNTLLVNQTKERHVPLELQKPVAAALDMLNLDDQRYYESRIRGLESKIAQAQSSSERHILEEQLHKITDQRESFKDKIDGLKKAYKAIETSADPYVSIAYNANIASMIDKVSEEIGDTLLRDMNNSQLNMVYDLYKGVLKTVRDANKLFAKEKAEGIIETGDKVIEEIKKNHKVIEEIGAKKLSRKKFWWNNLKPVYAFEKIGSPTLTKLFKNIRKGEDVWITDVTEAKNFFRTTANKYHFDSWKMDKTFEFKSNTGRSFKLNLPQMMSLYAYVKRDQSIKHLTDGGFVFDNNKTIQRKGKEYVVNTAQAYNISTETLGQIISKLSKEQMNFVDDMQNYLSEVMGAKGNEVSRAMYDIELFRESNYFPLKSAKQFMVDKNEVTNATKQLVNSGFTKPIQPGANNPIILSDFMDVWANHVNDMSMYHSFVMPIEDFNKVYNFQFGRGEDYNSTSVKQTVQDAFTKAANDYIEDLIKDINGGARVDPREGTYKQLLGNWKKAAVFASASVVIQQPSAIGRALAEINLKYFLTPTKVSQFNHKKAWEQLKKYAPVAAIKEMGYFDADMGMSTVDFIQEKEYKGIFQKAKGFFTDKDYRDSAISFAPAMADEYTWCAIWDAVKRETKAKHKNLNVNSEEFLKIAGERFSDVITKTQVYDSVLSRSANMRSHNIFMQMLTAFMAEPTTSANMAYDAMLELKAGNKKKAVAYISSVGTSVVLNSLLVSLVYAMRDDDEDERYHEKYLQSLTQELIDGINPLTYIPFIKDIWSIFQGWDVERVDMSLIADLYDNLDKTAKKTKELTEGIIDGSLSDEEIEAGFKELLKESALPVLDTIASMGGVPLKNVRRDIGGVINTFKTFANQKNLPYSDKFLWETIADNALDQLPFGHHFMEEKDQRLLEGMRSGNDDYMERMKNTYTSEESYLNAVRGTLKAYFLDGELGESQVKTYLMVYGDKDLDEADSFLKSWKFEKKWGFAWSKRADAYYSGEVGAKTLERAIMDYTGGTEAEAVAARKTLDFKRKNSDTSLSDDQIKNYYSPIKIKNTETFLDSPYDAGISERTYTTYMEGKLECKGVDKDGDGKADSGSVKKEVMAVIDSLDLTKEQKDILYFDNGWAKSTLWEAPWR